MQQDLDVETETFPSKNLPDHFCNFLENDILGRFANMWVKMSQMKGRYGPNDRTCIKLSRIQQISVDFAKHGKNVTQIDLDKI